MRDRNITYLTETIKREIDRMCVTDRLSEVDTMALHAHENIRILQRLRYKQLVNDSQGVSQAEQTEPNIDIVWCENCRKSHIDGKTTHYLWCTEWGRSTDTFGYCERADRKE